MVFCDNCDKYDGKRIVVVVLMVIVVVIVNIWIKVVYDDDGMVNIRLIITSKKRIGFKLVLRKNI